MDARGPLPHQVLTRMTKRYVSPVQEELAGSEVHVHRKPSHTPGHCRSHQGVALCFVVAVVCFETGSLLFAWRQGLSILQAGLELVKIPCLSSLSSWIPGMNYHIQHLPLFFLRSPRVTLLRINSLFMKARWPRNSPMPIFEFFFYYSFLK